MGIKLLALALCLGCTATNAAEYKAEVFISGYGFHGIHGIAFDSQDRVYVGSVVGQAIYRVDPDTGESVVWQAPPLGMADDIEVGPDGTLYWTSYLLGKIHARKGDGPIRELATGLPGINSLAMNAEGRLFATQVFLGDALYEIDPTGQKPPRKILQDMGGLNGFDFGADGLLYGPLWFKGQVAKVNVDTAVLTVVADGFMIPAAVNFNAKQDLFVLDTGRGEIIKVDTDSGARTVISEFKTAMDNLAFNSMDDLYVTVMAESAIYHIDTETGKYRTVKEAPLSFPADIDVVGNTLYISDTFAMKSVDLKTKAVRSLSRVGEHELEYSNGITVNTERIHQASYFNNAVQTLDANSGEILHTYHDLDTPFDVLELDDGSLIVLQMAPGNILRLSKDGAHELLVSDLQLPVSMARADANTIYVTQTGNGTIVSVNLETGARTIVAAELNGPEGIDVGSDGTIYVAEVGSRQALAIDPNTGSKTVLATDLPIGFKMPSTMPPMGGTTGIAVAENGDVYIVSDIEDGIIKITLQ